jgi:cell division protein FtsL
MTRLTILAAFAIALIAAVGVFVLKHEVQKLEQELGQLHRQILTDQEALHVLKAEWSHLNQPERLKELAQRHLGLEALAPGQIVRFEDLPYRTVDPAAGILPDSSQSFRGGPTLASAGAEQ